MLVRHGFGTHIWTDGSIYEGYWMFDQIQGMGRKIYKDGTVYVGSWKNGLYHEKGKLELDS